MGLYDDNHSYNILSTKPGKHRTIAHKGIYERLLCKKCEVKLAQWEGYARQVLYGENSSKISMANSNGFEFIVDYTKFKLFQVSILWRIGISTRKEFSSINLGAHEILLKKMLFEGIPGNTETYGCMLINSTKHTDITSNMIQCMGMSEIGGVKCVALLLGGVFWIFFLSKTAICQDQSGLFLQDTGNLRILNIDKDPNHYIENLAKDLYKKNPGIFNRHNKT